TSRATARRPGPAARPRRRAWGGPASSRSRSRASLSWSVMVQVPPARSPRWGVLGDAADEVGPAGGGAGAEVVPGRAVGEGHVPLVVGIRRGAEAADVVPDVVPAAGGGVAVVLPERAVGQQHEHRLQPAGVQPGADRLDAAPDVGPAAGGVG